jgi:hypothetical protein
MRDPDIHCAAARRVTHGDFERNSLAKRVASKSSDSVPEEPAACSTRSSTGTGTVHAEASRAVSPASPKSKASAMDAQHSTSSASAIAAATPRSSSRAR